MFLYAKYCPVAAATQMMGDAWTPPSGSSLRAVERAVLVVSDREECDAVRFDGVVDEQQLAQPRIGDVRLL